MPLLAHQFRLFLLDDDEPAASSLSCSRRPLVCDKASVHLLLLHYRMKKIEDVERIAKIRMKQRTTKTEELDEEIVEEEEEKEKMMNRVYLSERKMIRWEKESQQTQENENER